MLIRAPTGYTSVSAVLDAIQSGNPLIRLLFDRNCEHFDALEFSTGSTGFAGRQSIQYHHAQFSRGFIADASVQKGGNVDLAMYIMYDSCRWGIHFVGRDRYPDRLLCASRCIM